MADIKTAWDIQNVRGDFDLASDPQPGDDLATAVLISLMTDATASPDDAILDGSSDPRGWWGDQGEDVPIGSRIWLRLRSKQTDAVLALVKADIADALKWLVEDGVATGVDVLTEWTRPGMLGAQVVINRVDAPAQALTFAWAWGGL